MRHVVPALALLGLLGAFGPTAGCSELKVAEREEGGAPPGEEPGLEEPSGDAGRADAGSTRTDAGSGLKFTSYAAALKGLRALRTPGPETTQGTAITCAPKRFYWREGNGILHSWSGETKTRLDYTFTAPAAPFFGPSDTYVAVSSPGYTSLDVYDATAPNQPAGTMAYSYGAAATDDGVVRLEQIAGSTRVRKWTKATGLITDVVDSLPTLQPASSFGLGKIVIPGGTSMPFALHIVDLATKSVGSVTMEGGVALRQTLPTNNGLVVAYARTGNVQGIRIYKGDSDLGSARYEIGDEVTNRAPLYADEPANAHRPLTRIERRGNWILYDAPFGIWAYHVLTGDLRPVQLGEANAGLFIDALCVLEGSDGVVYREINDPLGRTWFVPLAAILD